MADDCPNYLLCASRDNKVAEGRLMCAICPRRAKVREIPSESERSLLISANVIARCTEELPDEDPFVIITALFIAAAVIHTAHRKRGITSDQARTWLTYALHAAINIAERTSALFRS